MANIKISDLPTTGAVALTDEIETNTEGAGPSVRRTIAQVHAVAGVTHNYASGTVAAPSWYLNSETGSGVYRIGANNHGYSINGTKLLDLSAALFGVTGIQTITANSASAGLTITQAGAGHALTVSSGDAICFDGSASGDTYIYESAANQLDIVAGAAQMLRIDADGAAFNTTTVPTHDTPFRFEKTRTAFAADHNTVFVNPVTTANGANSTDSVFGVNVALELNQNGNALSTGLPSGGSASGFYTTTSITGATGTITAVTAVEGRIRNTGAGTLTTGVGFHAMAVNSGGGTFTNAHSFYAGAHTVGSTLRTGFYGEIASNTGAWNCYMIGTANNAFNGDSSFGQLVAPIAAVDTTSFATNIVTNTGATYTVLVSDATIIQTTAASTYTLPAAASFTGRILRILTQFAGTVVSASSNVVPLVGGAAGTAILPAVDGSFATLQSNGTSWLIINAG